MKDTVAFLVAEDDSGHFALTKRCLRKAGFTNEILWFADGEELLSFLSGSSDGAVLEEGREYIMLLDIRMPKVDGIEVLETVKRDLAFVNIPVIVVSTSDAPANILRCQELGCDGYIVKPLGNNLVEAIDDVFSTC